MAISFYLPKDIDSVVKNVVAQGNTVSPNYISTTVSTPSILKRNLERISSDPSLDFNIIPLKLPATHSTGDVQKARTFDYDFVVSSDLEPEDQPVFVMDLGSYSFKVAYKTKEVVNVDDEDDTGNPIVITETTYSYDIIEHNVEDIDAPLKEGAIFRFTKVSDLLSKKIGSLVGERELQVIKAFNIDSSELYITVNFQTNIFTIKTEKILTAEDDVMFQSIDLCLSNGTDKAYSRLRFVGALTYNQSLKTFYPNNTVTQDIPNFRDYLDSVSEEDFIGYLTILKYNQALLFNLEVGTEDSAEYSLDNAPNVFEVSKLKVYQDIDDLLSDRTAIITTTGTFNKLDLFLTKIEENSVPVLSVNLNDPKVVYDSLKPYGILARTGLKDGNVAKIFLDRITGATPEALVYFRAESDAKIDLLQDPSLYSVTFSDLPGDNEKYSTASYGDFDEDIGVYGVEFSLSKPAEDTPFQYDNSQFGLAKHKAVQVRYANADSFDYEDYKNTENVTVFKAEVTDNLSGYGYEDMLLAVSSDMNTKLSTTSYVEKDKGVIHVSTKGASFDNLFVSLKYSDSLVEPLTYVQDSYGTNYNLKTIKEHAKQNQSEAIIRLNKNSATNLPVVNNNCSAIILDKSLIDNFNLQPYAYRVGTEKVEEQSKFKPSFSLLETDNLLTKLLNSVSPYFVSILPLYTSSFTDTNKILLVIDSVQVDQKTMKNLLVWTDSFKEGLTEGYGVSYKVPTGIANDVVTYGDITPIRNSSIDFDGSYVSMNVAYGSSNRNGTSFAFNVEKIDSTFKVTVTDLLGNSENCTFNVSSTSTDDDIVALSTLSKVVLTKDTDKLVFKTTENRVKVVIEKMTSNFSIVNSKLAYNDSSSVLFMLNKE